MVLLRSDIEAFASQRDQSIYPRHFRRSHQTKMASPTRKRTRRPQIIHRKHSALIRGNRKHLETPAQHPLQSQFSFSADRKILMEHNMVIVHLRHLLSLLERHELMREQFLHPENVV